MTTTNTSRSKKSSSGKTKGIQKTNKTPKETLQPIKEMKPKLTPKSNTGKHGIISGSQRRKSKVPKVTATKAKRKVKKIAKKKSIEDKTFQKPEISSCYCAELFEGRRGVGGKVEKVEGPEEIGHKDKTKSLEGSKLPPCWVCRLRTMARKSRQLRDGHF